MKFCQFAKNKIGRNSHIIFGTGKFQNIRAFSYKQHIILIMYTNTRLQSIGITSDFRTKFAQTYMHDQTFKTINIKIIITMS